MRPMSAQELQDETMLQWKPRTPAQAREDKALLERLPLQPERRSSSGTPTAPATTARQAHVRRRRSASTRRQDSRLCLARLVALGRLARRGQRVGRDQLFRRDARLSPGVAAIAAALISAATARGRRQR